MSTATVIFNILLLIASLIPIANTQQIANTAILATEEFTSPASKYVAIIGDAAFNWFDGRDICLEKGYVISQINTTIQHQQIENIILSSAIPITDCWLGAFGFFIPNISIAWTWDAFGRNISWNQTFASQRMVAPSLDVDPTEMLGLLIRINSGPNNNEAIWSYDNAELSQNEVNGRRCVICLDITSNATSALSPTPIPGPTFTTIPTDVPTLNPTPATTIVPTSQIPSIPPTASPSFNPTYRPITRRPTNNWDRIDDDTGEIKLDQRANQSCDWRELECGHCLDILRIAIISREQPVDQLLEQYDAHDDCQCFGGIGIEQITENNKSVLTVHTMNGSAFTFAERETDQNPDDISLSIANWRGDNETCDMIYYVNRHSFLGVKARNILMIEFDMTGITRTHHNLPHLLRSYFSNESVAMEEANNVTVYVMMDNVCVIIFTDSGEDARKAQTDLEASKALLDGGWDENIEQMIHNKTGDTADVVNVKYHLLSSNPFAQPETDDDTDTEHSDDGEVKSDEERRKKVVIGGTLLVVIIFSCILASILIITYVVYSHCKDKQRMPYQKPQVTRDNISEIRDDTSDCEGDIDCEEEEEEGEMDENEPMLHTAGLDHFNVSQPMNISHLNVSRRIQRKHLNALDDEHEAEHINGDDLILYPGGKTPYENDGKDMLSSTYMADTATVSSEYSVKTSVMNFDLSSNVDMEELVPSLIDKVCNSNYTRLIPHEDLWIEDVIGEGHYGEVYEAMYDGNKVAVKSFKDCKKQYARTKEIYSEVVLASILPSHPNIVQILGITQNPLNIVMTYYEGGNLHDFIYKSTRSCEYRAITLNSILHLMQKIADGLLFLHNNKIVHRDIATRNVLLGHIDNKGQIRENSKVVISDFGMTRSMATHSQWSDEQQTKQKIGAIKWMAPESIVKQKYSYKSDVYMFGITMFEIMHGKEPYTAPRFEQLTLPILAINVVKKSVRPHINEEEELESLAVTARNDSNTFVIREINKLMRNCWDKSPQNRPSMITILHELNSIYDAMLGL